MSTRLDQKKSHSKFENVLKNENFSVLVQFSILCSTIDKVHIFFIGIVQAVEQFVTTTVTGGYPYIS